MMCLMSKSEKTVQKVTQEIIDIMSLNRFPRIPFSINGVFDDLVRNLEALESDVFYFQDLIEMWYIDRKRNKWTLEPADFSQWIVTNLRFNRIRNYALVSLLGRIVLSPKYYYELIKSYIRKLAVIKITLGKWLKFLFQIENKLYSKPDIHDSLKLILN